jgi:hypothetical protein
MSETNVDPRQFINDIQVGNLDFYKDRRGMGALKDLQQTFPNPWLYVGELLQNAVDEKATRIKIVPQGDDSLLFEHSGSPFSASNVESLCMRGVSSKGAGTVGFMGIGFKSVFRSFERAEVSSGPWRFALTVANRKGDRFGDNQREWLGAVAPEWADECQPPSEGMTCRFRLSRRLPDLPAITDDLEHVLGPNADLLALLAWQGVEELSWGEQHWNLHHEDYPFEDGTGNRVELSATDSRTKVKRTWVLFSSSYQPSNGAIARFLEHRQLTPSAEDESEVYAQASRSRRVAIFCETDRAGVPLPVEQGSAFALLPTGVTFPLGVHVQADWLLVVSRRELMQIEGNEWHEEILAQLPILIEKFLTWLVGNVWPTESKWYRGYNVLPAESDSERETDVWFAHEGFRNPLADSLRDLEFLPVPSGTDDGISFVSPAKGRELPKPLATLFKDDLWSHRFLFGEQTFSSAVLGERALKCLNALKLIGEISAQELEEQWRNGVVEEWFEQTEDRRRYQALAELLEALASLDDDVGWRDALLRCLPSETGDRWICRDEARRYPPDWAVLSTEDAIREALQGLMGDTSEIVRWSFDRYVHQQRSPGSRYIDLIDPPTLEDLVGKWWESLPDHPTDSEVDLVLRFTAWIRAKQPLRKSLVKKLLTKVGNVVNLLPTAKVLVTDPYAEQCRRIWFPEIPVVASEYLAADSSASPSDWGSFFDSLVPPPQGRFALKVEAPNYSTDKLRNLFGSDYSPPSRRVSDLTLGWQGLWVTSDDYRILDAHLPETLAQRLEHSDQIDRNTASAIALWITESPAMLKRYSESKLVYIPYGCNFVFEAQIPKDVTWKKMLRDIPWIFSTTGDGPFRPVDILGEADLARADTPVADVPPTLVTALREAGIDFGSKIPNAPAIMRLRAYGASASLTELLTLTEDAIMEAGADSEKKELLIGTLRSIAIFPLPSGRQSLDHRSRLPIDRIVRSERGRSNFNSWLSSIESFPDDSQERQLFELVDPVFPFPTDTTGEQALDFLAWVWRAKPDANSVRALLPLAYQYVLEDLSEDLKSQLEALRPTIVVFTQTRRQWMDVADENLFLNDLTEAKLPESIKVSLATPGHLGDNRHDQIELAELLGLKLLSERFSIETFPSDPYGVPDVWRKNFAKIQRELLSRVKATDDDEIGSERTEDQPEFPMSRSDDIYTVVLDDETEIERYAQLAALMDGVIYVTGTPADFAEPVCQILFNQWGLRLRRDLVDLIPKVAIQISRIDDESYWSATPVRENESEGLDEKESLPQTNAEKKDEDTEPVARPDSPSVPSGDHVRDDREFDSSNQKRRVESGGGHTATDREGIIRALVQKKSEIDRLLREATSTGVLPPNLGVGEKSSKREFESDERFRDAVMDYERNHGRFPQSKMGGQAGHDIDSFHREEGNPNRKLLRRIEVKGKGVPWEGDEIVEQSDRQYRDAWDCVLEPGVSLAEDCDYWLYVVEDDGTGKLNVLPIRNPAKRAAHYEFRAGTWRHIAEVESEDSVD